jgi:predicted metal-dependent peptidase
LDSSITDFFCYQISGRVGDLCSRILGSLELRESGQVPMMGVTVRDRHYVLMYNPDWIAKADYEDVAVTVKHEAYHILFGHIPRHLELEARFRDNPEHVRLIHKVSPLASDMAVNSLLIEEKDEEYMRAHRKEWVLPGQGEFDKLAKKMSYEWYVGKLIEMMKKNPETEQQVTKLLILVGFDKENANSEMFQSEKKDEKGEGGEGKEAGDGDEEDEEEEEDGSDEESDEEGEGEGDGDGGAGAGGDSESEGDSEGGDDTEGEGGVGGDGKEKLGLGIQLLINHHDWNDINFEQSDEKKVNLADELTYQAKTLVKQAVAAHMKACGTMPGALQEVIKKMLKEPQVPWERVFHNIVASGQRTRRKRSLGRPRRRHIAVPELMLFPGKKKDYTYHVAFLIDTSASMSSTELEMALSELEGMRKVDKDMTVTVVEADAAVERVYELGSGKEVKYDMCGRGGTSFDPALKYAQELLPRPDAVFYFTDGYAPAPRKENRVPCLFSWIITPNGKVPDEWGMAIHTKPYVD